MSDDELCGRPRVGGTPCRNRRLTEWFPDRTVVAPACGYHLTDEDRAAYDLELSAARAPFEAAQPACWSWPLPVDPPPAEELAAWQHLLDWHQDGCAVCGRQLPLDEDHDHETELTRGWLCTGCNVVEGLSLTPLFRRYRERPPASMLGLRITYHGLFERTRRRPSAITGPDAESLINNPS